MVVELLPFIGGAAQGRSSRSQSMALLDPQQAQEDFETEQERRKASFASLKNIRELAAQGVGRVEQAGERGRAALGARSAQALAATLGQVGSAPRGGGQGAVLRQAAATRGVSEAAIGVSQAQELAQAKSAAAEKHFETLAAEEALGTLTGERQQKITVIENNLQNLIGQHLSGTLGIGDDPAAFRADAQSLLAAEGDPIIRAYATRRINEIFAANNNFNFINATLFPLTGDSGADAGL